MIRINFLDELTIKNESAINGLMLSLIHWLLWLGVAMGLLFYVSVLFRIKIF